MAWINESKSITIPDAITMHVENDTKEFVEQELIIYNQNPDNTRLDNSVIVNIALFDLSALSYEVGYTQIKNLLSDHSNQMINRRLKQLLLTLYLRYTEEEINKLSVRTLDAISSVFDVDKSILIELDNSYNTFWLQPFIRKAYNDICYTLENVTENSEK